MSVSVQLAVQRWCFIIDKLSSKESATRKELEDCLRGNGLENVSTRNLQRDIQHLKEDFQLEIILEKGRYSLKKDVTPRAATFIVFLETLLSSGAAISHFEDVKAAYKYISFGSEPQKNTRFVFPILRAIDGKRLLRFKHRKFDGKAERSFVISPYYLKEYLGRWYVYGKLQGKAKLCFFGLDRMSDLEASEEDYEATSNLEEPGKDAIGIMLPPDKKPVEVLLEYKPERGNYIKTLPLHHSQRVIEDTRERLIIRLRVIPNCDLVERILKDGDTVKVLKPASLAAEVVGTLTRAREQYGEEER